MQNVLLKNMNLSITNEKDLTDKVKKFRNKCSQIERFVNQTEEDSKNDIKLLAREKSQLEDKL